MGSPLPQSIFDGPDPFGRDRQAPESVESLQEQLRQIQMMQSAPQQQASIFDGPDPFGRDGAAQQKHQNMTEAIEGITGGQGFGSSTTRGALRVFQAASRPFGYLAGDSPEMLNEQQAATAAADPSFAGQIVQEGVNMAGQAAVLGPIIGGTTGAIASRATEGLMQGGRAAQLAGKTIQSAATNIPFGAAQAGFDRGIAHVPEGAAFGAAASVGGAPFQGQFTRNLAEGVTIAAVPGAIEGRAPTAHEWVMGLGLPVVHGLAEIGNPSRTNVAKVLGVKGYELPPELATTEGRQAAIAEATRIIRGLPEPQRNIAKLGRDNQLFSEQQPPELPTKLSNSEPEVPKYKVGQKRGIEPPPEQDPWIEPDQPLPARADTVEPPSTTPDQPQAPAPVPDTERPFDTEVPFMTDEPQVVEQSQQSTSPPLSSFRKGTPESEPVYKPVENDNSELILDVARQNLDEARAQHAGNAERLKAGEISEKEFKSSKRLYDQAEKAYNEAEKSYKKAQAARKRAGKPVRTRKVDPNVEVNEQLRRFRTDMESGKIRGVQGNEDIGGNVSPRYTSNEGAYSPDTALQHAYDLGLTNDPTNLTELHRLLSESSSQSHARPEDAATASDLFRKKYDAQRRMAPIEVAEPELDIGDLVYRNGEWHKVTENTDDGLVLKDGKETVLGYDKSIPVDVVIKADDELHPFAVDEFKAQEAGRRAPDQQDNLFHQEPILSQEAQDVIKVYKGSIEDAIAGVERQRVVQKQEGSDTSRTDKLLAELRQEPVRSYEAEVVAEPEAVPAPEQSEPVAPRNIIEPQSKGRGKGGLGVPPKREDAPVLRDVVDEPPVDPPTTPEPEPDAPRDSWRVTSMKNAFTDIERETRGADPIDPIKQRDKEAALEDALSAARENPDLADTVVEGLLSGEKKSTSKTEQNVVLLQKAHLMKERDAAGDRASDPKASDLERAVAQEKYDEYEAKIERIDQAAKIMGSQWSSFGNERQLLLTKDNSFEYAERKKRMALGRPLERHEVEALRQQVKEMNDALAKAAEIEDGLREKLLDRDFDPVFDAALEDTVLPADAKPTVKGVAGKAGEAVGEFAKAWEELLGGGKLGVVPTAFTESSYKAAKPHFDKAWASAKEAGKDAGTLIREMVSKYGADIKPYIRQYIKDEKIDLPRVVNMEEMKKRAAAESTTGRKKGKVVDPKQEAANIEAKMRKHIDKGGSVDDLRILADKLALQFVRDGVTKRGVLIDKVHTVLKSIDGTITRDKANDLVSGYGHSEPPSKDPARRTLTGLKGELQEVGKIVDMLSGRAPKATGKQRLDPTQEKRRLTKRVNELKRRGGYTVKDPEKQLRTALDAIKTRLNNEITDLTNAVANRIALPSKRSDVKHDAETQALIEKRNEKKREYDAMFPKAPMTDEQLLARTGKALDRSIAQLEKDLGEGTLYKKAARTVSSKEVEAKRAQLDALREERQLLRDLDTEVIEKKREQKLVDAIAKAQAATDPKARTATVDSEQVAKLKAELAGIRKAKREDRADELSLQAYKARLAREIADASTRLETKDFAPRTKPEPKPIKLDADAQALKLKAQKIKEQLEEEMFKDRLARRTRGERTWDTVQEVLDAMRAVKSSWDISAPGRQGALAFLGHPIYGTRAIKRMFEALKSEQNEFDIIEELRSRPNGAEYEKVGLFLHDRTNSKLSSREESFRSRLAKKVPGVSASERAYTTFLNVMRADMYDALHASLAKNHADSAEAKYLIANYINTATGRGGGKGFEESAKKAALVLWSPRFVLSRFQYGTGHPLWTKAFDGTGSRDTVVARKLIAAEYARTIASAGLFLSIAAAVPGVSVGTDPFSTDFGKIIIGNTRIDILGGVARSMVFLARTIVGKKTTGSGRKVDLRGPESQKFGAENVSGEVWNFVRQKMNPALQITMELLTGEDAIGRPVSPATVIAKSPAPLPMEQAMETIMDEGATVPAVIKILLSLTGVGVQTYETKSK